MDINHHVKISLSEEEDITWGRFTDILDTIASRCHVNNAEEKDLEDETTYLLMCVRDYWYKWISDEP